MAHKPPLECILTEFIFVTLDPMEGVLGEKPPKSPFLGSYAAVPFMGGMDLGDCSLVTEFVAVAVVTSHPE